MSPHLFLLLARRDRYEPPDQSEPDAADPAATGKKLEHPNRDQEKSTGGTDPGGNRRRAQPVTPPAPKQRSQDPAAVERKGREQVEDSEQHVDTRQPSQAKRQGAS